MGSIKGINTKVAIAVVVALGVVGCVGYIWYLEPTQLGHAAYAHRLCRDVLQPLQSARRTENDNADLQRFRDGAARTTADRERAISAFSAMAEGVNRHMNQLGDFNDRYVLVGEAGNRFQHDLNDALDIWADSYIETRADIEALDPTDTVHLSAEMAAIKLDIGQLSIDARSAPVVSQLQADLAVESPTCAQESTIFAVTAP